MMLPPTGVLESDRKAIPPTSADTWLQTRTATEY